MSADYEIGIIKWFDQKKGFGVIGSSNNEEYFLHYTNTKTENSAFSQGIPVHFKKSYDSKREKLTAYYARPLEIEDYEVLGEQFVKTINISGEPDKLLDYQNRKRANFNHNIVAGSIQYIIKNNELPRAIYFINSISKQLSKINRNFQIEYLTKVLSIVSYSKSLSPENMAHILSELDKTMNNYIRFKLWKEDYYHSRHIFNNGFYSKYLVDYSELPGKIPLPFDVYYLEKVSNEITEKEVIELKQYNVSGNDIGHLIEKIYNNLNKEKVRELLKINSAYKNSSTSLGINIFDIIINNSSNDLIFDLWESGVCSVNTVTRTLKLDTYSPPGIDKSIILENSSRVDRECIDKIKDCYNSYNDIILNILINNIGIWDIDKIYKYSLLVSQEKRQLIWSKLLFETNNFINYIFKYSSFHICENIIIKSKKEFVNKIISTLKTKMTDYDYDIEIKRIVLIIPYLSRDEVLSFFKNNGGRLDDNQKLKVVEAHPEQEFIIIAINFWRFESPKVDINFIYKYAGKYLDDNREFIKKIEDNVNKYSAANLIYIYGYVNSERIAHALLDHEKLFETGDLERLLRVSGDKVRKKIGQKFSREWKNIKLPKLAVIVTVLINYNVKFDPDILLEIVSKYNLAKSDKPHNFLSCLLEFDENKTIKGIKSLITTNAEDRNSRESINGSVGQYIFTNEKINLKDYAKIIFKNKYLKNINSDKILSLLCLLVKYYPCLTLKYSIEYHEQITSNILEEISVDSQDIGKVLVEIDNIGLKKISQYEETDIGVVAKCILKPSIKNINKLNNIFKNITYYNQDIFYKYLSYLYLKERIDGKDLIKIINNLTTIQLNAVLLKAFIGTKIDDRYALMDLMNLVLKRHFKLLSKKGLNKKIFQQIFSLEGLLNRCNSRKQIVGAEFWSKGGRQRYYTKGEYDITESNHFECSQSGSGKEIYCEGRFWKSTPLYDSESNKPLGESVDIYWCRGKPCLGVNDNVDLKKPFFEWTLYEINHVFQKGLDRLVFAHLAGWLNRMNTILDLLNCRHCGELLRPKNFVPKQLGHYAAPLFQCVNEECYNYQKVIRFTHCRGCNKILDSRDCDTCDRCSWLICDDTECGLCGCGADHHKKYVEYPE